jgi:hypothetical protein
MKLVRALKRNEEAAIVFTCDMLSALLALLAITTIKAFGYTGGGIA